MGWGPWLEGNSLHTAQWDPPPIGTTKQHHWMTPLLWHRLILCEIWKPHYNKSSLLQAGLGRYIHGGLWLLLLWRSKGELQLLCLFFSLLYLFVCWGFLLLYPYYKKTIMGGNYGWFFKKKFFWSIFVHIIHYSEGWVSCMCAIMVRGAILWATPCIRSPDFNVSWTPLLVVISV